MSALDRSWFRTGLAILLVLVLLAPVFGWAAGQVGYAEPLDNAAEATGATDAAETVNPGLMPDYGVPGLGAAPGTLLAALVGTALTLVLATGMGRVLAD
ncbi:cobalt/nickel transport protein [Halomicrobium zhouii]|uniref:Cobalt/nickel transport protein n=1 Tax=Halomicrobium zhouii TaxID=767519 RepID=A0A1I6K7L8_9EURY|nr:PDGLE domain-containing protein [Halomicrobium zhouii]SFR87144.1 cobalt/nickel transport protein [Halomicrobium zhouii]